MVQATMFEAKTQLSELVKKAQRGEKVILTMGRNKVPVAEIIALEASTVRPLGLFHDPNFELPADFDEMPEDELRLWNGEGE